MWAAALALMTCALAAHARSPPCSDVRMRCAYRSGCGAALNNYMELCAEVLSNPMGHCPEPCQHALIALTSTEEGKDLMNLELVRCIVYRRPEPIGGVKCAPAASAIKSNLDDSLQQGRRVVDPPFWGFISDRPH
ncbi:hypothetical protein EVAR_21549_1 [Eumeta japonica]|uniref:Uncharacterized protein n=1 Tax=Eumeta variegata TaxID=151549 RepID=A0A4C1XMM3_EUMVA|nr:hypothetical protein EVAR_21549_1 [Eumeta japonica]